MKIAEIKIKIAELRDERKKLLQEQNETIATITIQQFDALSKKLSTNDRLTHYYQTLLKKVTEQEAEAA